MALPNMIATGNLKEILGGVLGSELAETALSRARVLFRSNVANDTLVEWDGSLYRVGDVSAFVDGNGDLVNEDGGPVRLLANNDDLSIHNLQWQVRIELPGTIIPPASNGKLRAYWFTAGVDGETIDLATVTPVPSVSSVGGTTRGAKGDSLDNLERDGSEIVGSVNGVEVGRIDISDLVFDGDMDDITDATTVGKAVVRAANAAAARTAIGAVGTSELNIVHTSGDTSGATDHAAITAAIGSGNTKVDLVGGDFYVDTSIIIQNRTWLNGIGMFGTRIHLVNGVNDSVIRNFVSTNGIVANAEFTKVSNLSIDGNKANQTGGHGIEYTSNPDSGTKATNDDDFDTHQYVQNVRIANCKQDGFNGDGRSSMVLDNVYAVGCDRNNFKPAVDSLLINCVSSLSGYAGFESNASSVQFIGCKSFFSGQVDEASGDGFHIFFAYGNVLSGCHAQNNWSNGYSIVSSQSCSVSGVSDTNSMWFSGWGVGVDIWDSTGCEINVACITSDFEGNSFQRSALRVRSSATRNSIDVTHGIGPGGSIDAAITSDSVLTGNRVVTNGRAVPRVASVASSATPTINTDTTDQFNITALAAAITSMTTNLSGTPYDGQLLDVRIKGDATPRAITHGASFTGTLLTTTAANKTHLERLKWDAAVSKWVGYYADGTGY